MRLNWTLTEQTHLPINKPRDWISFLCPSSQLHITFNLSRSASTDIFTSDPFPEISSYFHDTWSHRGLQRLYLFGATSSCTNMIIKKKKKKQLLLCRQHVKWNFKIVCYFTKPFLNLSLVAGSLSLPVNFLKMCHFKSFEIPKTLLSIYLLLLK